MRVEDSGYPNKSCRDEVYRTHQSFLPRRNWASFGKMSSYTEDFFIYLPWQLPNPKKWNNWLL